MGIEAGQRWRRRGEQGAYLKVRAVRSTDVELVADDTLMCVPLAGFEERWEQEGETIRWDRLLHPCMLTALKKVPNTLTIEARKAALTEVLREELASVALPDWMTPAFWAVGFDPSWKTYRVVPTVLQNADVHTVVHEDRTVTVSIPGGLFAKGTDVLEVVVALARVIATRSSSPAGVEDGA